MMMMMMKEWKVDYYEENRYVYNEGDGEKEVETKTPKKGGEGQKAKERKKDEQLIPQRLIQLPDRQTNRH